MKKTSVYLSDDDRERLATLAERDGKSQARVLREALAMYDTATPDKNFAILHMEIDEDAPGIPSFATAQEFQDWLDTEGMKGFGDDSLGDFKLD